MENFKYAILNLDSFSQIIQKTLTIEEFVDKFIRILAKDKRARYYLESHGLQFAKNHAHILCHYILNKSTDAFT